MYNSMAIHFSLFNYRTGHTLVEKSEGGQIFLILANTCTSVLRIELLRHDTYTVNKYKEIIGIIWVFYQLPGNPSAPT